MRIKPRSVTREIKLLTDPQPGWMAFVDHGANQTPWNSLKSDGSPAEEEQPDMAVKGKGATKDHRVVKLTFSKALFPTEDAVKSYMDSAGIDSYEIVDDEDVWAAKSTEDMGGVQLGKARSTSTKTDGVFAHIAEVIGKAEDTDGDAADDQTDAEDATAEKNATKAKVVDGETVKEGDDEEEPEATAKADGETTDTVLKFPEHSKKYDSWAAYMSNAGTLMEVLQDGTSYDGVPPGVDEVISALYYTTGNILTTATAAEAGVALKQAGDDYATLVLGLFELFTSALTAAEKGDAAAKKYAETFKASFQPENIAAVIAKISGKTDDNVSIEKTGEATTDDAVEDETTKADAGTTDEAVEKTVDEDPAVALIKSEVLPMLKDLTGRVEKVETASKEAGEKAEKATKTLERAPVRRSLASAADDFASQEQETSTKKETETKDAERREDIRRMFGSRDAFAVTPRASH